VRHDMLLFLVFVNHDSKFLTGGMKANVIHG
jgi:hypothetical protein